MNFYAIVNGINSICSLAIALVILISRPKKLIHLTYGLFSLLLFFWAFLYFLWAIQTDKTASILFQERLHYPANFIHIAFFHFVLIFTDNVKPYRKLLIVGYFLSFIFLFISLNHGIYDVSYVRNRPPFPYWMHGTKYCLAFVWTQVSFVLLSFFVLVKSIKKADTSYKARLVYFLLVSVIGWGGGLTNWFYCFDTINIPPIGNPGVTLFLIGSAYLIFKHDILGLNLVIKRTFVYALLTLFISLIYTIFILVSERLFQTYLGYRSLVVSLLAALTISVLFNPLRGLLIKFLDKTFFGKDIIELSTENLQMRSELIKQGQMKAVATLAAGMAHEIKNPLTAIKTFTEQLPMRSGDPQFVSQFNRIVSAEVHKIDSIVRQLLEFSKPTPPQLEDVSIQQILDETIDLLNGEFLKKHITVEKQSRKVPYKIRGDKKQLKQVFLNLFLNAIDAMPSGGILTVSAISNPNITISITDTGSGIAPEDLPHIFDPFFTKKQGGTGLGLSIVHGIIKEHGGKIEAKSQPDHGTTFTLSFLKSLIGNQP